MARCLTCGGEIRATSALRCPFCGVSLAASETPTTSAEVLARDPGDSPDPIDPGSIGIGDARFVPGRVFAARFRIVSLLAAVASLLIIMMHGRTPDDIAVIPALHSLRSSRLFASRVVFLVLDSLQFSLGSFFLLLLCRVVLRRTWLAVMMLLLVNLPLSAWAFTPAAVSYAIGIAGLFCFVVLQLGLLAGVTMLATQRVLTSLPMTLDFDAWYVASSVSVLLLVLGVSVLAFRVTIRVDRVGT
jgi:hypothetical protein